MLNYVVLKHSNEAPQMRIVIDIVFKVFIIVTTFKKMSFMPSML